MSSKSNLSTDSSKKLWRRLFIGIISLQAILELGVGATLLFNLPMALESGFGITYNKELDILGIALGLYLLLLTTLMVLSAVWTSRSNISGTTLGIIVGLFLFIFGVATFLKFGDFQGILVDGIRGFITIVLAYMAGKELQKQ